MIRQFKLATIGVGLLLSIGLTGCGNAATEAFLEQALATPTLAIKNNGQSLEVYDNSREQIDGVIFLLRSVTVYDEKKDVEHEVVISWAYPDETAEYWNELKERDEIPTLISNTPIYLAAPIFPKFGEDPVDSELIATATLDGLTKSKTYPITLLPEIADYSEVPLIPLNTVNPPEGGPTDTYGGTIVRVQGYLTRHMLDWDSAYLHDGTTGINLYKLSYPPELLSLIAVGDYIEAMGTFARYGGMRQLSYITRIILVNPGPTSTEPTPTIVTEADWPNLVAGDDGKLVTVTGLTFDAVATGDIILGGHFTFYMKLGALSIKVYLNYHNDVNGTTIRRQAIADVLTAAVDGATVTFTGVLGWYNGPQLLPIPPSDVTLVPAA